MHSYNTIKALLHPVTNLIKYGNSSSAFRNLIVSPGHALHETITVRLSFFLVVFGGDRGCEN